ncbi:hypothetical protein B0H16DRAFT_1476232 [Mycena metata]|uniref:Uncharacterized protein n=1 Tax=Mycena metata TaxID=1033252 RepID=A0AAD7HBZ1_9AGAR|nr:hypothetical protein B0H16DRAFT_1476232 [Mycena metata]
MFDAEDDRLWVDIYEPTTEAELAVHVRKVQDVRRWLDEAFVGGPSGKLRKYREFDCAILEWRNAMEEGSSRFGGALRTTDKTTPTAPTTKVSSPSLRPSSRVPRLARPSSRTPATAVLSSRLPPHPHPPRIPMPPSPDPPNILHAATQQRFHAALQSLIGAPQVDPVPVVVIARDERLASGVWGGGREGDGVLDVRVVQGRDLLGGPYVTEIGWIQSHRTNAHETHFASAPKASGSAPTKEMLDIVVETSNGDIRSAIMALQFSCVPTLGGSSVKAARKKGGGAGGGAKLVLEAVTRREQSLTLFHFMGRVLYNKERRSTEFQCHGEGHLAGSGARRDAQGPAKAAQVLGSEERRTSRVNVDVLGHDRTKKLSHEEGSGVLRVHGLGTGTRCGGVYATCAPSASVKRGIGGKGRCVPPSLFFTVPPSPPLAFPALSFSSYPPPSRRRRAPARPSGVHHGDVFAVCACRALCSSPSPSSPSSPSISGAIHPVPRPHVVPLHTAAPARAIESTPNSPVTQPREVHAVESPACPIPFPRSPPHPCALACRVPLRSAAGSADARGRGPSLSAHTADLFVRPPSPLLLATSFPSFPLCSLLRVRAYTCRTQF